MCLTSCLEQLLSLVRWPGPDRTAAAPFWSFGFSALGLVNEACKSVSREADTKCM